MVAAPQQTDVVNEIFECFLCLLAKSFDSRSVPEFIDLLLPNGYLREYVLIKTLSEFTHGTSGVSLLICHWNYASVAQHALEEFFQAHSGLPEICPKSIKPDKQRSPPLFKPGVKWIQYVSFSQYPILYMLTVPVVCEI